MEEEVFCLFTNLSSHNRILSVSMMSTKRTLGLENGVSLPVPILKKQIFWNFFSARWHLLVAPAGSCQKDIVVYVAWSMQNLTSWRRLDKWISNESIAKSVEITDWVIMPTFVRKSDAGRRSGNFDHRRRFTPDPALLRHSAVIYSDKDEATRFVSRGRSNSFSGLSGGPSGESGPFGAVPRSASGSYLMETEWATACGAPFDTLIHSLRWFYFWRNLSLHSISTFLFVLCSGFLVCCASWC